MSDPATNDVVRPVPRTELGKGRVLEFDFPGLEIGVAEYEEGPTGCTVFSFGMRASVSIDVRGGSPDVSAAHRDVVEVVCFAGGSLYGLEASAGAAAEMLKRRDYSTKWMDIALVSGAILYDYGPRGNAIYPDKELGRAAIRAMRPGSFPMGARGAGRSATASHGAGAELAGQGGAYRAKGPTKILAFVVVNSYGCIVDRTGKIVRQADGARAGTHTAFREHDALARGDESEARPSAAPVGRPAGARFDGPRDPAIPRAVGRRRELHGVDAGGRERRSR